MTEGRKESYNTPTFLSSTHLPSLESATFPRVGLIWGMTCFSAELCHRLIFFLAGWKPRKSRDHIFQSEEDELEIFVKIDVKHDKSGVNIGFIS